jgi:hypothetical protein
MSSHLNAAPGEARSERVAQRLRALPSELAPPFDWSTFKARSRQTQTLRRAQRLLAAAACLAVIVTAIVLWRAGHEHELRYVARTTPGWLNATAPLGATRQQPPLGAQVIAGPAVERALEHPTERQAIVNVSTRLAIDDLEDRVASVDDALSEAQLERVSGVRVQALQQRRARLIDTLALVRYAETTATHAP